MNPEDKQTRNASKEVKPHLGDSESLVKVDSPDDFSYEGQFTSQKNAAKSAPLLNQSGHGGDTTK